MTILKDQTPSSEPVPQALQPFEVQTVTDEMRSLDALPETVTPMPDRLPIADVEELQLFTMRTALDDHHVERLASALRDDADDLLPILVLRRGGRVILVDGRHRMKAYKVAGRAESIPVVEFQGSPKEALLEAQRVNNMPALGLTKSERMDAAWKLVRLDASGAARFTLPQIEKVGASRAQATKMRQVLRALGEPGMQYATWREAYSRFMNQPQREYSAEDVEEMLNKQAEEAADKLVRVFGNRLSDRPEVLARTIEIYSGRRFDEVMQSLLERNGYNPDEDANDDF